MHRLCVRGGQTICGIHGRVRRDAEEEQLADPRIEDFERRPRLVRRRRLGNELSDQRLDLAEATHRLAGNGARKARVARWQLAKTFQRSIKRPLLAQNIGENGLCGGAGRDAFGHAQGPA